MKHTMSDDGLTLSVEDTLNGHDLRATVSWKTREEAEANRQNALDSFQRNFRKLASESRQGHGTVKELARFGKWKLQAGRYRDGSFTEARASLGFFDVLADIKDGRIDLKSVRPVARKKGKIQIGIGGEKNAVSLTLVKSK